MVGYVGETIVTLRQGASLQGSVGGGGGGGGRETSKNIKFKKSKTTKIKAKIDKIIFTFLCTLLLNRRKSGNSSIYIYIFKKQSFAISTPK